MVKADALSDKETSSLANEIAQKLRAEVKNPGQLKVSLIKENAFTDFAS